MSESNPVGRPSKYDPDLNDKVIKFCEMGATNMDLAEFFGVSVATITNWKRENPEFLAAINEGKRLADERVEQSLYKRATGYSHPEEKIFCSDGSIVRATTTKHYPPDSTAMIYWLKNRKPKEWRDKHEMQLSGPDGGPIQTEVYDLRLLTDEQIEALHGITDALAKSGSNTDRVDTAEVDPLCGGDAPEV